nr:bifunctional 3-dehydroquinate dehydratase/shikimate dehydrogenase, chloroplastic-like [Tanacetum cinerariifolium]
MLPDFELHQETCAIVEHGSPFYATSNGEVTNESPIAGRLFVLIRAGGTGRALAFGAKSKGDRVSSQCLARAVSGEAFPIKQLETHCLENGMILANCSAIGMEPDVHLIPVSK